MQTTDYNKQAEDFLQKHDIKFRATLSDSKVAPWHKPDGEFGYRSSGHHYRVTLHGIDYAGLRMVLYSLWREGHNSPANREACHYFNVLECASETEASSKAIQARNDFREGKPFVSTVAVYGSHGSEFGFFVCKTLEPEPNVFVNHHAIIELDAKQPESIWALRSDCAFIEKPRHRRITFDFWGSIQDQTDGKTEVAPYDVLACISGDVHCLETFKDFCAEFGEDEDSIKALQTFRRCSAFAKRLRAFFTAQEIEDLSEIR